jgi:hypothetical protein
MNVRQTSFRNPPWFVLELSSICRAHLYEKCTDVYLIVEYATFALRSTTIRHKNGGAEGRCNV